MQELTEINRHTKFFYVEVQNSSSIPQRAYFQVTRSSPILTNTQDWTVAVSNFFIPSSGIPLLYLSSISGHWVTITYQGTDYQTEVVYKGSTINPSVMFNLEEFIVDINDAFATAYNVLISAHPGALSSSPWFAYQNTSNRFHLHTSEDYVNNSNVQVYVNYKLYSKMNAFDADILSYNSTDHKDVKFFLRDLGGNRYSYSFFPNNSFPSGSTAGPWSDNPQFARSNQISDIRSITLSSTQLPVISEDRSIITTDTNTPQGFQNVIISYNIDQQSFPTPYDAVSFVYDATLYRRINMNQQKLLNNFDISLNYVTRSGKVEPLYIDPGKTWSVKFIFEKKL